VKIGVGLIPCDTVAPGDLTVEPECALPKLKTIGRLARGHEFMKL
jgi:hypothetical protein